MLKLKLTGILNTAALMMILNWDIEQTAELNKWKKNDTINFSANYLVKKEDYDKEKIFKLDQEVKNKSTLILIQ